jgi:mannose-6-phosphate isomerase-like protein (cupin superfamily)
MNIFVDNIEHLTQQNTDFRQVIYTGQHTQLVLMSLLPGEEIGEEIHEIVDQFFRVESGEGKLIANGTQYPLKDGDAVVIPAGSLHNIINVSQNQPLKLYTLYCPPHHKSGVIHRTKSEAQTDQTDHI